MMRSRDNISILVLMFLSAVMPFSFECIYPFINEVRGHILETSVRG